MTLHTPCEHPCSHRAAGTAPAPTFSLATRSGRYGTAQRRLPLTARHTVVSGADAGAARRARRHGAPERCVGPLPGPRRSALSRRGRRQRRGHSNRRGVCVAHSRRRGGARCLAGRLRGGNRRRADRLLPLGVGGGAVVVRGELCRPGDGGCRASVGPPHASVGRGVARRRQGRWGWRGRQGPFPASAGGRRRIS